jgi:acyl-CoA thioesterase
MPTADADFLGLDWRDDCRSRLVIAPHLARFDGRLYGGAALAVSIAAVEHATGRRPVWTTTHFVSTAPVGAELEVVAEEVARGRRSSQVRVTGLAGDEVVFAALGAAADHRDFPVSGSLEAAPEVGPPDEARPIFGGAAARAGQGWHSVADLRLAELRHHPDPGRGRMCLWVRLLDHDVLTPAMAGFLADMVPLSVVHGLGAIGAGTSLDNTLRIGEFVDTTWLLADLRPHLAAGGYGHGTVHLWSEDGRLVATGSQSASLLLTEFDPLGDDFPMR